MIAKMKNGKTISGKAAGIFVKIGIATEANESEMVDDNKPRKPKANKPRKPKANKEAESVE